MDYMLDDNNFDQWQKAADTVTAILEGDGYRDDVYRVIDTFADVNNLLEEYGFEPINTLEELKGWVNA